MTAETRRNRGPGRPARPEPRRGRVRVAGQRAAERRRQLEPEPKPKRRFRAPALPSPRLPRFRRDATERRSAPARLTAVLAVLVLLAAVGVGYLAVQLRTAEATEAAASNGQVTAARYAEQLLSYDHAHLDRDFAESKALLTDEFVKEYTQATDVVRDKAVEDQAVIKAQVVATSVVDAEPDRVKTLLFVNQTTTTGKGGTPNIDLNRVVLTLEKHGDRWLVGDLDAL